MNVDRWRKVESIYHLARVWDLSERHARLQDACGDDGDLRRDVEELLEQDERAGQILDGPAWDSAEHSATAGAEPPTLAVGMTLGVYVIEAPLGTGGMGAVWKARDPRLDRTVAIKVSRARFSDRVEREAKAVAALNHPNVGALYDVGVSPSGFMFLILEYVEGPTLADRIKRGPIPPGEVERIARQIAEAIEAAHERGIIHRDLKPANIKLRPDGTVKVLDFGLAKALEETDGQTSAADRSVSGVITGTAAYMSPEQAVGKKADRRADIWSFGVIVYEMLAGRRPFAGDAAGDIIDAVIKEEPAITAIPDRWRGLVARCLTKDPRQRLQSIGEARIALEPGLRPTTSPATEPARSEPRWMFAVLAVLAVLVLVAGGAVAMVARRSPAAPAVAETRLDVVTPATNDPRSFALSPDGRSIAYVATADDRSILWVRSLAATSAQSLASVEGGAAYPFWSPDSRSIGFFSNGKLRRVDVTGGSAQDLADAASGRGAAWSTDGIILFAPTSAGPIFRVPAAGGAPAAVTALDWSGSHRFPQFLPDNRHFLFYAEGAPGQRTNLVGSIMWGSLDSAHVKPIVATDTAGLYMPPDWLVWVRSGALVAAHFDIQRGDLTGQQVTVADSVFFDSSHARLFSTSATGLVAYRRGTPRQQLTWFDRSGKSVGVLSVPAEADGYLGVTPRVSPDGRWVSIGRRVRQQTDVWLLDGTHANRFTFSGEGGGIWAPDGKRIIVYGGKEPRTLRRFFLKSVDAGDSTPEAIEVPPDTAPTGGILDWSPDGRFLLYQLESPQTGYDLWATPLAGDRKPWIVLQTKFDEKEGRFSPNGKWIAYVSNATGRPEVYVRSFADPASAGANIRQWQISLAGGLYPAWRRDGKELYWVAPDGRIMAAPFDSAAPNALQPGSPIALFQSRIYGGGLDVNTGGNQFDVAPDGRILINTIVETTSPSITLLQNWRAK
jgi:Tol biopolymer transport system component/tRNA A-37 threonylcarbamoyl transferase component Bud32